MYFQLHNDNTLLFISSQGDFADGFDSSKIDQTIHLSNVDLVTAYTDAGSQLVDQTALINDLMQQGKLMTD